MDKNNNNLQIDIQSLNQKCITQILRITFRQTSDKLHLEGNAFSIIDPSSHFLQFNLYEINDTEIFKRYIIFSKEIS